MWGYEGPDPFHQPRRSLKSYSSSCMFPGDRLKPLLQLQCDSSCSFCPALLPSQVLFPNALYTKEEKRPCMPISISESVSWRIQPRTVAKEWSRKQTLRWDSAAGSQVAGEYGQHLPWVVARMSKLLLGTKWDVVPVDGDLSAGEIISGTWEVTRSSNYRDDGIRCCWGCQWTGGGGRRGWKTETDWSHMWKVRRLLSPSAVREQNRLRTEPRN